MDIEDKIIYFTVGELMDILKEHPKDMPVVVSGYESGYENFYHPFVGKVEQQPENSYHDGQFQLVDVSSENTFDALVLERQLRDD